MADYEATGEELEKLVRLGKKRPMPFAFCPPNGDDEALFATHRKKQPELIAKSARKASGQTKVAFGYFTVEGKTMILVLHKELPQIAKRLKKHLKRERLWLNIKILDLMGNELEADIEPVPEDQRDELPDAPDDDEDEIASDTAAADTAPDVQPDDAPDPQDMPDPAVLASRLKALEPRLAGLPAEVRGRIAKPLSGTVALLKSGDLIRAEASVTAIERVLSRAATLVTAPTEPGAPQPAAPVSAAPVSAAQPAPGAQPAAPAPPPQASAQPTDPAPAVTETDTTPPQQKLASLQTRAAGLSPDARGKVETALGAAAQKLQAGDPAGAAAVLDRVEAALGTVSTPPPPAAAPVTAAESWAKAEAKLQPVLLAALGSGKGDPVALRQQFARMQDQAAGGNPEAALALLPALKSQLSAAAAAPKAAPPVDVQMFLKSRQVWSGTRGLLKSELARLKTAIDSTLAGMPDMAGAASRTAQLLGRIDRLDGRLEQALATLALLPEGPKRDAARQAARGIIADYQAELDSPFFTLVDKGNGFVPVNLRGPAVAALGKVSAVLA